MRVPGHDLGYEVLSRATRVRAGVRQASLPLVALTVLLLAATAVSAYVRLEVIDRDAFAARATASLRDQDVRAALADKVVDGLGGSVAPEALIAAPLLAHGVATFAGTDRFARLFSRLARDRHEALIDGRSTFAFDVLPGTGDLLEALRGLSPRAAAAIPPGLSVPLIALRPQGFELRVARALDDVASLVWPLSVLSFLVLALCLGSAGGLRPAVTRLGLILIGAGGLVALFVAGLEVYVVAQGSHALGIDAELQRRALHALWSALFGDLGTAGLLVAAGGAVLAAAPLAGALPDRVAGLRAGAARVWQSPSPGLRYGRAFVLLVLGAGLVLQPGLVARAGITLAGLALLAAGVGTLAGSGRTSPLSAVDGQRRPDTSVGRTVGVIVATVAAVAIALAVVLPAPSPAPAERPATDACNGSRALCERPLQEVVFPATHNSYAASVEPGWLFPNQRLGIARQLRDGIRGFTIDTHYGVVDPETRRVRTPLAGEGSDRNKVAQELSPAALRTADRVAGRVGSPLPPGPRNIYLCHTLCELGAEPIGAQLGLFRRFLEENPREVLMVVVEPYVTPRDFTAEIGKAGLLEQVATLQRDDPLPTLGQLIAADTRLVVFDEVGQGTPSWFMPAFSFIQDTPYQARTLEQLSCRRYRGTPDSPLLLVNHWIATFPPSPRRNRRIADRALDRRLARCEEERGQVPNLVAVDFYERSGVIEAARRLNERAKSPGG